LRNSIHSYFNESMALGHASFFAMNTNMELVICGLSKTETEIAFALIYDEVIRIEKMLNRFDSQSDVAKLNTKKQESIEISQELYGIIELCLKFNKLTNYFFDVCINSEEHISTGKHSFELDKEKCTIRPANSGLNFDFGAFAKGYALQKIKDIFSKNKISNALINFGNSSIMALGHHPHGNCWKVCLQHNFNPKIPVYIFDLFDEILSTSGVLPNGKAHIRSPFTGKLCIENSTYSVVSKSAVEGEAISTALYASNDERQQKIILKNFGISKALKVFYTPDNCQLTEIITDFY